MSEKAPFAPLTAMYVLPLTKSVVTWTTSVVVPDAAEKPAISLPTVSSLSNPSSGNPMSLPDTVSLPSLVKLMSEKE